MQTPAPRQQKPVKLKRMARVKDQHIVSGACGSHKTYLVADDGKVFMFGSFDGDLAARPTGE